MAGGSDGRLQNSKSKERGREGEGRAVPLNAEASTKDTMHVTTKGI